jgi:hypothetical protein
MRRFLYNRKRYAHGNEKKKENEKNIFFLFVFGDFVCVLYFFSVVVVANNRFQQPQDKSVGIATKKSRQVSRGHAIGGPVDQTQQPAAADTINRSTRRRRTTHTQIAQNTHTHTHTNKRRLEGGLFYFLFFFSPIFCLLLKFFNQIIIF